MKTSALNILRVGTAVTFLWIGVLIIKDPTAWTGLVQSWVEKLLPFSLDQALIDTAILDLLIGFFLLIDRFVLTAALLGFLHLSIVLVVVGITSITVRDIGLIASTLALVFSKYPEGFRPRNFKDFISLLTK